MTTRIDDTMRRDEKYPALVSSSSAYDGTYLLQYWEVLVGIGDTQWYSVGWIGFDF